MINKIFIATILCFIALSCMFFPQQTVSAQSVITFQKLNSCVSEENIARYVNSLGEDRTAYTEGEKRAANFLSEELKNKELEFYLNNSYSVPVIVGNDQSQNIIGKISGDNKSSKVVILGAHYDNTYSIKSSNGEITKSAGFFDNLSGVSALLSIIDNIKSLPTKPYTYIFAFFGAEEVGQQGSKQFIDSMTKQEKDTIALYVNFDSICLGDKLYYYSGEGQDAFDTYLNNINSNLSLDFQITKPNDMKWQFASGYNNLVTTNIGLMSDNINFMNAGVQILNIFSGNLENNGIPTYVESEKYNGKIYHTEFDNHSFILNREPKYLDKINSATEFVFNIVNDENLGQISRNNIKYFSFFNNIYVLIVGIILATTIIAVSGSVIIKKITITKALKKVK